MNTVRLIAAISPYDVLFERSDTVWRRTVSVDDLGRFSAEEAELGPISGAGGRAAATLVATEGWCPITGFLGEVRPEVPDLSAFPLLRSGPATRPTFQVAVPRTRLLDRLYAEMFAPDDHERYNPHWHAQPRGPDGKWISGGGAGSAKAAAEVKAAAGRIDEYLKAKEEAEKAREEARKRRSEAARRGHATRRARKAAAAAAGAAADAAAAAEPPELGPSKAQVEISNYAAWHEQTVNENLKSLLGPNASLQDLASLTGATDDARVQVHPGYAGNGLKIYVKGRNYEAERTLKRDHNGKLFLHNDIFEVSEGSQKSGLGLQVFARQVENATRMGIDRIETHAAGFGNGRTGPQGGRHGYNGYWTWPRFGYEAELDANVRAKIRLNGPVQILGATHVSDVMKTKEGRDWWLIHGSGFDPAVFDLKPGSLSQRVLHDYRLEKIAEARASAAGSGTGANP